jgi:GNAT superfamily N-acetyltransferase
MHVRLATPADAAIVAGVLSAAAANLRETGKELWSPAEVSELAVSPHIGEGLYHLGLLGAEPVGVFRLQPQDPDFWPEIPAGTSMYLHKLALIPSRQGQGLAHLLLGHAAGLTRARGCRFLRLDCMGGRPQLRIVYERFGFRHHSQKVLGGQPFERFEFDVGTPRCLTS